MVRAVSPVVTALALMVVVFGVSLAVYSIFSDTMKNTKPQAPFVHVEAYATKIPFGVEYLYNIKVVFTCSGPGCDNLDGFLLLARGYHEGNWYEVYFNTSGVPYTVNLHEGVTTLEIPAYSPYNLDFLVLTVCVFPQTSGEGPDNCMDISVKPVAG